MRNRFVENVFVRELEKEFGKDFEFKVFNFKNNPSENMFIYSVAIKIDEITSIYQYCMTADFEKNREDLVKSLNCNLNDIDYIKTPHSSAVLFANNQYRNKWLHENGLWPNMSVTDITKTIEEHIRRTNSNIKGYQYLLNEHYSNQLTIVKNIS